MRPVILVERPIERDEAKLHQLARCLAVRDVTWIHTYRAAETELVVFEAADAERVRESHRSAAVVFTRAWAAELHA